MANTTVSHPAIPLGSLVLITGVNGLIASHVADQCLAAGYRVRGTTRDVRKNAWIANLFSSRYGPDAFELVEVKDMTEDAAFDAAVKGCAAVAHIASNMSFSNVYKEVVGDAVNGALSALKSAAKETSVKRFVLTSSSTAAALPKPGQRFTIYKDTWNDEAVRLGQEENPDPFSVYAASKTEAERNVWKWVQENKPSFVVNAVLPNANFGRPLDPQHQGHASTTRWAKNLFTGNVDAIKHIPPQYYVDLQDTALLHLVALTNPNVRQERIFAWAGPFNFNDILSILRKLYPDRKFCPDFPNLERDLSVVEPAAAAEQLLKEVKGSGWTSLEEAIKQNTMDLV